MANKQAGRIKATVMYVECPHCQGDTERWVGDPRSDSNVVCEHCGEKFDIPDDCDVDLS